MKKRIINGVKNGQSLCEYKVAHIVEMLRGKKEPTIIHTDQGSVYSSKAYNALIQDRAQVAVFHSFHSRSKA